MTDLLPAVDDRDAAVAVAWDGRRWHRYVATNGVLVHQTAAGDAWLTDRPVVVVAAPGPVTGAPAVVHDGDRFHMFARIEAADGSVWHLVSSDAVEFVRLEPAVGPVPGGPEASVGDPVTMAAGEDCFLVYDATGPSGNVGRCAAKSGSQTWWGPWLPAGPIPVPGVQCRP